MILAPTDRRIALAVLVLLALATACYWPGLDGTFLFDDFVNLNALGSMGPIDDGAALARYLTSASGDPTGRPLSLLSFLIDARDWPADPAPFLRTNLILHLLNGALLFLLLRRLGRILAGSGTPATTADWVAVFGMGAWLLHPLLVSTTLYIVQREAMLPTTFTLLGMLAYLHGRERHAVHGSGLGWIAVGIGACGVLATLSKANGILLPVLVLTLEATVLRASPHLRADLRASPRLRGWLAFWLLLPALVVAAYLAWQVLHLFDPVWNRTWTRAERLLTQPRILLDYLGLLLVPRMVTAGLFNDGIVASTGLFTPVATLPALLGITALVALAVFTRKRAPALSAALLFYFAGHLLESTVIALELYFEHRNYLPSMLLFWGLGWSAAHAPRLARVRPVLAVLVLALFAFTLRSRADLWSQPVLQAKLWAIAAPESARAQSHASMLEISAGQPRHARARMHAAWQRQPLNLQITLNYANTACEVGGLDATDVAGFARTFATTPENGTTAPRWLEKAVTVAALGQCPGLTLGDVDRFAASALANPALNAIPGRRMDLRSIRGMVALELQQPLPALEHFDHALAEYPNPSTAARQSAALASRGWPRLGLRHLDYYDTIKPRVAKPRVGMDMLRVWVLEKQGYWATEQAVLRQRMHEDIAAGKDKGVAPPLP